MEGAFRNLSHRFWPRQRILWLSFRHLYSLNSSSCRFLNVVLQLGRMMATIIKREKILAATKTKSEIYRKMNDDYKWNTMGPWTEEVEKEVHPWYQSLVFDHVDTEKCIELRYNQPGNHPSWTSTVIFQIHPCNLWIWQSPMINWLRDFVLLYSIFMVAKSLTIIRQEKRSRVVAQTGLGGEKWLC